MQTKDSVAGLNVSASVQDYEDQDLNGKKKETEHSGGATRGNEGGILISHFSNSSDSNSMQ